MRALFLNENIGGHATVHHNLERALDEMPDIETRVINVPAATLARRIVGASVPGLGRLDLDLQPLRAQLAAGWTARRMLRQVEDFDVLHVYTQNSALLATSILGRVPAVVTLDSTNELNAYRLPYRQPTRWTPRMLPLSIAVERHVYDAATLVVAESKYAARSLRTTYGLPESKLRVLPIGVWIPDNLPSPDPDAPPQITFVGRQMERKGGFRLLRMYQERLQGRCLLNLVTTEPVDPSPGVRVFSDFVVGDPRLPKLLVDSTAFVFPSEIDQSPNAVLEAMACGLPVVALRVGALPEMVEDGVSGFVVDRDDDAGLLAAIESLLDAPDLAARMGKAGRRRALDRYDVRKSASALVTILGEAIERFKPDAR